MHKLDRNNFSDAKRFAGLLLESLGEATVVAAFFADGMRHADKLNTGNWNLNLDLDGKFLRFNTGQVYCVEAKYSQLLVLCLKDHIPEELYECNDNFYYHWEMDGKYFHSHELTTAEDALARVPGSVGVMIKRNPEKVLPQLLLANSAFIEYAIKHTTIWPQSRTAHSIGAVDYLSFLAGKDLPNPDYALQALEKNEEIGSKTAQSLSDAELKSRISHGLKKPKKITSASTTFIRNPYVAEMAKRQANGICYDCKKQAPFVSKVSGEPYLEVHHTIPLADGGPDTLDNVVALCPNCHRKRHYG